MGTQSRPITGADGEKYSGDTFTTFEDSDGIFYAIICDGMGSGYEASRESKMTADLLSGFLKAGFSKNIQKKLLQII